MAATSYNQLKSQLNELITKLEDDSLDIDEAIKLYDQSQNLIVQMGEYLKTTESKIKKITKAK